MIESFVFSTNFIKGTSPFSRNKTPRESTPFHGARQIIKVVAISTRFRRQKKTELAIFCQGKRQDGIVYPFRFIPVSWNKMNFDTVKCLRKLKSGCLWILLWPPDREPWEASRKRDPDHPISPEESVYINTEATFKFCEMSTLIKELSWLPNFQFLLLYFCLGCVQEINGFPNTFPRVKSWQQSSKAVLVLFDRRKKLVACCHWWHSCHQLQLVQTNYSWQLTLVIMQVEILLLCPVGDRGRTGIDVSFEAHWLVNWIMILHNHLLNLLVGKGQRSQDEKSLEIWAIQPVQEMSVNSSGHKWPRDNRLKKLHTHCLELSTVHPGKPTWNLTNMISNFGISFCRSHFSPSLLVVCWFPFVFCGGSLQTNDYCQSNHFYLAMAWHTQRSDLLQYLITLHYPSAQTSRDLGIWVLTPLKQIIVLRCYYTKADHNSVVSCTRIKWVVAHWN